MKKKVNVEFGSGQLCQGKERGKGAKAPTALHFNFLTLLNSLSNPAHQKEDSNITHLPNFQPQIFNFRQNIFSSDFRKIFFQFFDSGSIPPFSTYNLNILLFFHFSQKYFRPKIFRTYLDENISKMFRPKIFRPKIFRPKTLSPSYFISSGPLARSQNVLLRRRFCSSLAQKRHLSPSYVISSRPLARSQNLLLHRRF